MPLSHNLWTPVLPDQARRPSPLGSEDPQGSSPGRTLRGVPTVSWLLLGLLTGRLCPDPHPSICLPGSHTIPSWPEK